MRLSMPCRALLSLTFLAGFLDGTSARAEVLTVRELSKLVETWKAGKKKPPPLVYQVEGRLGPRSSDQFKLRNCSIPFLMADQALDPQRRLRNVEVTGVIELDERDSNYVFRVSTIREAPSDVERYHETRRRFRPPTADKWYELGDWAEDRGRFYKDQELLALSLEARQKGIELEHKALTRDDPQAIFSLVEKAKKYRIPAAEREAMLHEAWYALWTKSRTQTGEALVDLAQKMAEGLPGATEPAAYPRPELFDQYFSAPDATYRKASEPDRRRIHRLLYSDIILRTITPKLAADGSNGFEIAEQIDKLVPEQHALAEKYRDRALAARAAEVERLSRAEMLALRDQFHARQQSDRALKLVEAWLTLRRRRLEPDDTEGLLQLTEEYRALLKQHDLANRLLIEAHNQNPKATDVAERLEKAGFRRRDGIWVTEAEFNRRPEGRLEQAIRDGKVETGMTAAQVRRSVGEPMAIARSATAGLITEVWTFELTGGSRLAVRLVKNRRETDLAVVDVAQVKGQ